MATVYVREVLGNLVASIYGSPLTRDPSRTPSGGVFFILHTDFVGLQDNYKKLVYKFYKSIYNGTMRNKPIKQRPGQVCISIDPSIKRDAKVYAVMHGITLNRLYEEAVRAYIKAERH